MHDVAVVGVADAVAGELPKAYVAADDDLDPDELLAWVAAWAAPYKKIRLVQRVPTIPRLARRQDPAPPAARRRGRC